MFPELFKIGPLSIHTYGFFIALGIIISLFVVKKEAERVNLPGEKLVDILFWGIWTGLIGSRIFYVLYFPDEFRTNLWEILKIWKGGLVFQGGLIFAIPVMLFLLKKNSLPLLKTFDVVTIGVPLAHFFGRLGCFSAGCCYGEVCDLPWAVTFTNPLSIAPKNLPLHPTQLYEAFSNLLLFFILLYFRKKVVKRGAVFGGYLVGYGIIRFVVEFYRGDPRGIFLSLSLAQWLSLIFVCAGLFFLLRKYKDYSTR